jgi:hypothetical protein
VQKDLAAAAALYERGCDAGSAVACTNVGVMYDKGSGVALDPTRALALYKRGCNGGDASSCELLKATTDAQSGAGRTDGLLRGILGAATGLATAKASGASTDQTIAAMAKGVQEMNPQSEIAAKVGAAGDALLLASSVAKSASAETPGARSAGDASGTAGARASFATKPNLAGGSACSGFTMGNYRAKAMQQDANVQLNAMCGQAFELYSNYLNAIAKGFSEAECNRTYAAHSNAWRVAKSFYEGGR